MQSTPEERAAWMQRASTDYRGFYGIAREMYLPVSPETGRLLYLLARASKARAVVEFGTSFGLSTIHLAAALHDNGGGRLVGSDLAPSKIARATAHLREAGLADLCDLREGDALQTLARDLPEHIDLLLLDGAKVLYLDVLALVRPRMREGALIVADNADQSPAFLAHVRDPKNGYLAMPFGDDVELAIVLEGRGH